MWKGCFGYCMCPLDPNPDDPLDPGFSEGCNDGDDLDDNDFVCVDPFTMYIACLFWALGAITGFSMCPEAGPYPPPSARAAMSLRFTRAECIVLMIILFIGALIWVYVTAKFVDVISNSNPEVTEFRQTIDNLNRFIAFNKLPKELSQRLREYYYATKQMKAAESRAAITEGLSPALQEEVALLLNKKWLRDAPFFNGLRMMVDEEDKKTMPPDVLARVEGDKIRLVQPVEDPFLAQVAMHLKTAVYAPQEMPPRGRLYLIYGGGCMFKGKFLGVGKTFGEIDVMLEKPPRVVNAVSVSFLHVFYITRADLNTISFEFPKSRRAMKTWAMYNGLKEYLMWNLAEERRKAEQDPTYDMYAPDPEDEVQGVPADAVHGTSGDESSI